MEPPGTAEGALCVFGGSFDPPHIGHVGLVDYALSRPDVGSVWVIPVFQHAFDKALTPFDVRLRMCELAFGSRPGVVISELERELGGESRTLRLVEALAEREPGAELRLLVGADVLAEVERWHRFEDIAAIAPPLVIGRGGLGREGLDDDVPTMPEVSSSELRRQLAAGADVSHLVPSPVAEYITEHGLYRGTR